MTNNFIRAGEAVEIEGCREIDAVYVVANNRIVQTPTRSNMAQLTKSPGLVRHGGHPAAIKPLDSEAALVIVRDNSIDMRQGPKTGVCVMTGNSNKASATRINGNTCNMKGQFAAILGGWAGTPGLFNPSYMHNASIRENRFIGRGLFGVALLNFSFLKIRDMALINKGHDNVVYNNDVKLFRASRHAVELGLLTRDNVVVEDFRGSIRDRGYHNTIDLRPYLRIGR
ncbi:MAG: hypothetical protein HOI16_03915 [Actinobacteria bacterium]|nr:hypothetical protein [Actinomycetota bacterium]